MNYIITSEFKTPFGELLIGSFEDKLCLCDWRYRSKREAIDHRIQSQLKAEYKAGTSAVIQECKKQLSDYFNGNRKLFTLPLLALGSAFQKSVWLELIKIPFGNTISYTELSRKLGNELAIRAAAAANGANAISIIIPCHRVLGSDGSLTGYAGGLKTKKALLRAEGALIENQLELFNS